MSDRVIRIGTRGSALAIAQSEEVVASLRAAWPQIQIEVIPIMPDGDRRKTAPLQTLGRGTFVKGLEEPLLKGEIDLAVHSAKDMPSTLPGELAIVAYPERKDPRDVIVNRWHARFEDLPAGAKLGTSSPRRAGQLLSARPDINIVPIRGNVDTRLGKVGEDAYDGVVLASAGLERLGRGGEISDLLDPDLCVPDAGQGAIAVEAREDDSELAGLLAPLSHAATWSTVTAERAFVDATGGGCRVPVAAYAIESKGVLEIRTMACLPDGSRIFRSVLEAPIEDPVAAGRAAAKALEATGADEIMYTERIG